MDFEFEKYCKVDESPRTVLPSSQHQPKHEKSIKKPKSSSKNNQLSLEAGFKEIKFRNYHRSVSCKTLPTRNTELPSVSEVLKRGSVYQSSKERTSFKKPDSSVNNTSEVLKRGSVYQSSKERTSFKKPDSSVNNTRKKIEFSVSTPFSFSLLDSICGSDDEEEEAAERDLMCDSKYKSDEVIGPSSNANILKEDDNNLLLQKSHFAKLDSRKIRSLAPRNNALRKSLLHEFSSATPPKKAQEEIFQPSSPAHLHGDLKVEYKHGVPQFELSLAHSNHVLVAKSWKAEDALNWVYTFHSIQGRKKSRDSSMVGQMQVLSHLCSELNRGGTFSESMITEFVLYDIVAANGYEPWASEDLHPSNEIAAVVIQAPFEKRESLKHRSSDAFGGQVSLSLDEQTPKDDTTMVNVVIPLGNHSLPSCESGGPLSLLDRWRLGGGCDCGGWEMACPLVVFDNKIRTRLEQEQRSLLHNNQPFKLYLQGSKEKTPALTMKFSRKGHYSVDFHAQLSALQALAVCVSILHASEAESSAADQEKQRLLLQCISSNGALIEAVKEEENKGNMVKGKVVRATQEHRPHCFVLNPPFSPIARV